MGANPAIFSVEGFSAELLYYCVFRYLKSNSSYAFIVSVRSDLQVYYHSTADSITLNVLDSNCMIECAVLYKNILSNIQDFITSDVVLSKEGFDEESDGFIFNPIKDQIEYILLLYIGLDDTSSTYNTSSINIASNITTKLEKALTINYYNSFTRPTKRCFSSCYLNKNINTGIVSVLVRPVSYKKAGLSTQHRELANPIRDKRMNPISLLALFHRKYCCLNKSFKLGSPIFNNLNTIIRDNPINEETQIKIEKFLFDYSYISLKSASLKNLSFGAIDYSVINPSLTKILIESENSLIKLIANFQYANLSKANSKSDDEILYVELANILKVVSKKVLISIMYGYLLKILSSYERQHDNLNSVVDIGYNLGRDLMNYYYYKKYLKVKKLATKIKDKNYYLST